MINPVGVPRRAFNWARRSGGFALSDAVWDEIVEVLHRPGLARYVRPCVRDDVLTALRANARWFSPHAAVTDCRDPKDNKYLDLALTAEALAIVSSDNDLLVLHPWRGIDVLRPAEFLALM